LKSAEESDQRGEPSLELRHESASLLLTGRKVDCQLIEECFRVRQSLFQPTLAIVVTSSGTGISGLLLFSLQESRILLGLGDGLVHLSVPGIGQRYQISLKRLQVRKALLRILELSVYVFSIPFLASDLIQ
jgi:hypothetical protein